MLPTLYDRQTESSYCCIQPAPSQEDGTASLCFVSITTCSILGLNLVFELIICLLYHLQLHTPVRPRSGCTHNVYSSAMGTMFGCKLNLVVHYNYCMHKQFTVKYRCDVSVCCTLFHAQDLRLCDKSTPLDYEQCGART